VTPLGDQQLYDALLVVIALLLGGYVLFGAFKALHRSRPGFDVAAPIGIAFGARVLTALGLGQLSVAQELRGGDEQTFLERAEVVSELPLGGRESLDMLTSELHVFLFSGHLRIFDPAPPEDMLRVEMIIFAVLGILLLSAAVYELAGRRAAIIAAWILALEPSNVFFSSLLHKEPLMYLAEGLVVFGGALLWKRGDMRSLLPLVVGCLLAIATRPYVGWFLVAAAAAVVLHASLRRQRGLRALTLLAAVVLLAAAFVPVAWDETSDENLQELQASQDANAENEEANLSLERIDYSSRAKLLLNAPERVYDVVFKPHPWQADNTSQQLGVLGTLVVFGALILLVQQVIRNRSGIMKRAAPLIYPLLFMLWAYAISAGNAGTAFRYRTHVVALALCLLVVLREHWQHQGAETRRLRMRGLAAPARGG
jgi:Dolichyl-phosphate-mannose-protein mannosyltransferase